MPPLKRDFPVLLTDRLRLRAPRGDDCGAFHSILSFPEVTRFTNWPDAPKKAKSERLTRWMCNAFPKGKGCAWIIEDWASSMVLGAVRFNSFDKQSKTAEIGYELHPSFFLLGEGADERSGRSRRQMRI
jgi:ribosomal-protein-alanine N-acetyltransferase